MRLQDDVQRAVDGFKLANRGREKRERWELELEAVTTLLGVDGEGRGALKEGEQAATEGTTIGGRCTGCKQIAGKEKQA